MKNTLNPYHLSLNSKIYVAGGTGMVGSAIIRKLVEKGYYNIVSNYYRKQPETIFDTAHLSLTSFHKVDLTRQADVEDFFEKQRPDYVFLAAAKVGGILANNTYKADFIYQNTMIATNIIYAAYRYGVKKLLNLGSSCIYPKFAPQPMKEEYLLTGLLEPTNEPYAIAKISAIKLCRYFNEQYGTNFISVMPTNLYGPNDNFDLETSHVLPALIRKFHLAKLLQKEDFEGIRRDFEVFGTLVRDKRQGVSDEEIIRILDSYNLSPQHVTLWGTGAPYREFLHVDDLVDACVFLMERYDYKDIGEFVNIGVGKDITIKELALMVRNVVGFDGEIRWDPTKPDGTPRKLLDITKIRDLGWQPKIPLEEGIKLTYQWYIQTLKTYTP
jgi:GDP-L-fucose synthase